MVLDGKFSSKGGTAPKSFHTQATPHRNTSFDIRSYTEHLTKGKKGKYECPVCGEPKLSFNKGTGKYDCYSCHDTKGIADKLREMAGESGDENSQSDRHIGLLDPIAERHKKEFRKSAIPDTWSHWNFKTLEDKREIAKFLGRTKWEWTSGWIATGVDPTTGESTGLGQFKPDKIYTNAQGEKAKYLTQCRHIGYEVLCLKVPTQPDYWQNVLDNSTQLVRIVEGGKKALSSMANTGVPTIGVCGVTMWERDGKPTLILQKFMQGGRPIEIAYDADIVRKKDVRKACFKLAKALLDAGCEVTVRLWDERYGKGIDDVIFNGHNFDEVSESLNLRELAQKWEKQFPNEGTNDRDQSPPKQTVFINRLIDKYRDQLAYDPKQKIWLHYGADNDGIWAKEEDVFICRMLKNEVDVNYPKGCSAGYIEGALKALKWELAVKNWDEDSGLLPLQNGVLRLSDKKLLKHSPKYHLTWYLPYSYEPTATCEPIIDWFKEMVGEPDQIELLRCYLAAIVRGDNHLHRFIELIGPGGTGKSTFTNLAVALVGVNNTHSTNLKKLEGQFETASIAGKRLVLINDSERYGGEVSILKALTGGDFLPFEIKRKQSQGGFYPKALAIMAANEPIQSGDYTSGLKRRRISLKFTNQIPNNQQRNLINIDGRGVTGDWVNYLPGLLNWVLGANEKTIFNYLKRTDEFCPSLKRHQVDSLLDSNPLADWADQYLVIREGVRSAVGNAKQDKSNCTETRFLNVESWLYASYAEHSFNTGTKKVASRRFRTLLDDLLNNQLGFDVKNGRDRYGSYFKGIAIRKETDMDPLLISDNPIDEPPTDPPSGPGGQPDGEPPGGPDPGPPTQDVAPVADAVTDNVTAETLVGDECDGCDDKPSLITTESTPTELESAKGEESRDLQPTVEEVAQDLLECESPESLSILRECYDRQLLQKAAKFLKRQGNKAKVQQIKSWVEASENDSDPCKEVGLTPEGVNELERSTKEPEPGFKLGDRVEIISSGIKGNVIQMGVNRGDYWVNSKDLPWAKLVSGSNLRILIE